LKINVVIAADANYLYPALVLIANLSENGLWRDKDVKLWLFSAKGELSKGDQNLIHNTVNAFMERAPFEFVELDLSDMPETHGYLTKTALVRLRLPEFLEARDWLWVDVDAVLCTSWNDLKTAFFPQRRTANLVAAKCHQVDSKRQQLSGNPIETYFNSGVISWKSSSLESGLHQRYLSSLNEFSARGVVGDDQDALNAVHAGDVQLIGGNYNAFGDYLFRLQNRDEIKVAHYAGATKPWHLPSPAQILCRDNLGCPWSPFYKAENTLFARIAEISPGSLVHLTAVKERARLSGHPDWKVIWFARIVSKMPVIARESGFFNQLRQGNHAHPLHWDTNRQ
jgi:lipopolysaccharide biosynthesis glycosyltransferase